MTGTHAPTHPRTHTRFTVFPSLDLRNGLVVRLAQGDPARQTVYGDDPAAVAERWLAEGAEWLHVVNLDGSFGMDGTANAAALRAILAVGLKVQLGGGLRDQAGLSRAIEAGAARVVLGTAAVEQPKLVDWAVQTFGSERVAAGIDAWAGRVRVRGWTGDGGLTALDLGRRMRGQGVDYCVFTDVERDGLGGGTNLAATVELAAATSLRVIASGGIAQASDVARVREAGLAGVIIGRALHDGRIRLQEVLHDRDRGLQSG
jgi:phosphoribosylformimino-5-aminoimidazole carboxamide ribotide isomerase